MSTHIVGLEVENVKRLQAVSITPKPGVNVVGGRNGQGKSSLLDAIQMAIGGAKDIPEAAIRNGAEKAEVRVTFNDGLEVIRTSTAKGSYLTVKNKDGAKFANPQALLDKLCGSRAFDPLAFCRAKAPERIATLKALVGIDTAAIDTKRKALYESRTVKNREVAAASHRVAAAPYFPNSPQQEVNPADIYARIQAIDAHNADVARVRKLHADKVAASEAITERIAKGERRITEMEEELSRARAAVVILKRERDDLKAELVELAGKVEAAVTKDKAAEQAELAAAAETNRCVQANATRAKLEAEAKALQKESDDLTTAIDACDTERSMVLSSVKYPIDGLSFSDTDVIYNGLPLESASSAEKIRVSVAIGAALNPQIRVMLIRDGSLLDAESMEILGQLAFEHDLQLWIERVGTGKECSVIIEDGNVLTAEGEA